MEAKELSMKGLNKSKIPGLPLIPSDAGKGVTKE